MYGGLGWSWESFTFSELGGSIKIQLIGMVAAFFP